MWRPAAAFAHCVNAWGWNFETSLGVRGTTQECHRGRGIRECDNVVAAWWACRIRRWRPDLYVHRQALDTVPPSGRALFGMLRVFAGFETLVVRHRTVDRQGLSVSCGRPTGPLQWRRPHRRGYVTSSKTSPFARGWQASRQQRCAAYRVMSSRALRGLGPARRRNCQPALIRPRDGFWNSAIRRRQRIVQTVPKGLPEGCRKRRLPDVGNRSMSSSFAEKIWSSGGSRVPTFSGQSRLPSEPRPLSPAILSTHCPSPITPPFAGCGADGMPPLDVIHSRRRTFLAKARE